MSAADAAREIRGDGTAEATWRAWDALARIEPVPPDALLPPTARCVVVAPHPDDEVLSCGGLLAMHAAAGGRCLVVGVTDGEASHAAVDGVDPDALAATRRAERLEGLRRLGATAATVSTLGIADGAVARSAGAVADALHALLRPDDVVITTWRLDGHPDHEACGDAAAQACTRAGCRLLEAPVWMWHWAVPDDPRVPWHRLRGVRLSEAVISRRRGALQAHASQWAPRSQRLGPVLTPEMAHRLDRRIELYLV